MRTASNLSITPRQSGGYRAPARSPAGGRGQPLRPRVQPGRSVPGTPRAVPVRGTGQIRGSVGVGVATSATKNGILLAEKNVPRKLAPLLFPKVPGVGTVFGVGVGLAIIGSIASLVPYQGTNTQPSGSSYIRVGGPREVAVERFFTGWKTVESFGHVYVAATGETMPATAACVSAFQQGLPGENLNNRGLYGKDQVSAGPGNLEVIVTPYGPAELWQYNPALAAAARPATQRGVYRRPQEEYETVVERVPQVRAAPYNRSFQFNAHGKVTVKHNIPPVRPSSKVKERKVMMPRVMALIVGTVTETVDLVQILFDACTNNSRISGLSVSEKAAWLFIDGNIVNIDLSMALDGFIKNLIQDAAIGKLSRLAQGRARKNFKMYGFGDGATMPTRSSMY